MYRTMQRLTMSALSLALVAGLALAQAPAPAPGGGGGQGAGGGRAGRGGGRGGRGGGVGTVVAINADHTSMTIKNAAGMDMAPTALPKDVKVNTLTALKVADIKTGAYAEVRGFAPQGATDLNAQVIMVLDKAPADTKGEAPQGFGAAYTGVLTSADGKLSIKAGEATLNIVTTETTPAYTKSAGKIDDVKTGANVYLEMKPSADGGAPTLEAVDVLPAGALPQIGGRGGRGAGGGRGGAGGGGRRGGGGAGGAGAPGGAPGGAPAN